MKLFSIKVLDRKGISHQLFVEAYSAFEVVEMYNQRDDVRIISIENGGENA